MMYFRFNHERWNKQERNPNPYFLDDRRYPILRRHSFQVWYTTDEGREDWVNEHWCIFIHKNEEILKIIDNL